MMFSNKVYDVLKKMIEIVLPAFCTLLITLNGLWHWGLPIEAIVGTITAIATFMGIALGISTVNYNKTKEAE